MIAAETGNRPDMLNTAEACAEFTDNLMVLQAGLEQHGVEYSLVGGLAIKAILGQPVHPFRNNGTVIDFDAIAFGPDLETIQAALTELQPHTKQLLFPELGIEPCIMGVPEPKRSSPLELLSSLRTDDGRYFLEYRDIRVEVPAETMAVQPRLINSVAFPCLPAKTILYRYLTRGGVMKEKDDAKLTELGNYIVNHESEEPADFLYRPYLEFAEQIRERYPRGVQFYDFFWSVDHALSGKISGSKGLLYSWISHFRK